MDDYGLKFEDDQGEHQKIEMTGRNPGYDVLKKNEKLKAWLRANAPNQDTVTEADVIEWFFD